jgi:hypothetical protein
MKWRINNWKRVDALIDEFLSLYCCYQLLITFINLAAANSDAKSEDLDSCSSNCGECGHLRLRETLIELYTYY